MPPCRTTLTCEQKASVREIMIHGVKSKAPANVKFAPSGMKYAPATMKFTPASINIVPASVKLAVADLKFAVADLKLAIRNYKFNEYSDAVWPLITVIIS